MTIRTLSYNDFGIIVEQSKEKIIDYIKKNNLEIDYIISSSKEDHIFNSMLAIDLNIESIFISKYEDSFKVKEILEKIKDIKNPNILLVQSLFNEEDNIELKQLLKTSNLYLLAAFIPEDYQSCIENIIVVNKANTQELKLPWDKAQFTPLNQLEKLQGLVRVNIDKNNKNFLGFSSSDLRKEIYITHPEWKGLDYISYQEQSEFNEVKKQNIFYQIKSIQEYEILNKEIIANKINFIEENGITEYFEENLIQAIILSAKLKVVKVIFFDDTKMYNFNTNYISSI